MQKQLSNIIPYFNCADTPKVAASSYYEDGFDIDSSALNQTVMENISTQHQNIKTISYKENNSGATRHNTVTHSKDIVSNVVTIAKPTEKFVFTYLFQTFASISEPFRVLMCITGVFNKAGIYPANHNFYKKVTVWRFLSAGISDYTFLRVIAHKK